METRDTTVNAGQARELTVPQVILFYFFIMFLGPLLGWMLRITGPPSLDGLVVGSGLYTCLFIIAEVGSLRQQPGPTLCESLLR